MKIGILGTRGIPNAYGGFEQFAQFLAEGLLKKGHDVWVYNSSRHPYKKSEWNGIHIIHCADAEHMLGTAGQFVYDFNCLVDARKRKFDILLQLGYTSNSLWFTLWPSKSINIVNMDGLEWKRDKYNSITKKFLRRAEKWAADHADVLVSDSPGIRDYLLSTYQKQSTYIPYGAVIPAAYNESFLQQWQLVAGQYFLVIARMEPENNIEMVIKGYLASTQPYPLVIMGNTKNKFGSYLVNAYPSSNIKFIGAIYDQEIVNTLRHFCTLYFHGHSVGGTNPSLLEAMACECSIAAHDNIFNKDILEEHALYFFNPDAVKDCINQLPAAATVQHNKEMNNAKVKTLYNWNTIVDKYEELFIEAYNKEK